jgi:hypothetical protein
MEITRCVGDHSIYKPRARQISRTNDRFEANRERHQLRPLLALLRHRLNGEFGAGSGPSRFGDLAPEADVAARTKSAQLAIFLRPQLGESVFRATVLVAGVWLCLLAAVPAAIARHARPPGGDTHVASYGFGFSGATVAIREDYKRHGWPIAERSFILTGANGRKHSLPLHKGGGAAKNWSLNLFWAGNDGSGSDQYFLISEQDCVEFDPVAMNAKMCLKRPPCGLHGVADLTYLGRFDWMNGFDPPDRTFAFAFRFLPFMDAAESGSCPR